MKILVLGSRGMLGQEAVKYFSRQTDMVVISDAVRFNYNDIETYIEYINGFDADVIINCLGLIKQKSNQFPELIKLNSLFPFLVARRVRAMFIHASTDCVFSGAPFKTKEDCSIPDCSDDYGISKYFGELGLSNLPNAKVIRASIIGVTKNYASKGLMDWFAKTQPGETVNGFANHLWNGITTLTWCEICHELITGKIDLNLVQPGTSEVYSKYEMLKKFSKYIPNTAEIKEFTDEFMVDRSLTPNYFVENLDVQLNKYFSNLELN
ncbi:sugar nucleotide-binding protein [Shewanella xiamenensis]|uniref:sugar nucleotide-binding protein n=1 Tax=Shewanella xiamenensis TaxID=332186 RepID=UPI0035B7D97F